MRPAGWILPLLIAVVPAIAHAQQPRTTCKVEPAKAFRGAHVRLLLPDGSNAKQARVTFHAVNGLTAPGAATSGTPPITDYPQGTTDLEITADAAAFDVDAKTPLGRYTVTALLDGTRSQECGAFQVALPDNWNLTLKEFSPGGTFNVPVVTLKPDKENVQVKTISLKLRGSGFLTDVPSDNRITINDVRQAVTWVAACPEPPSTKDPPSRLDVHGVVVNSEQIELCRVQLPAGWHRVVTVEVSQEGVPATVVRHFRLYWWDRKIVGTLAAAIAVLLAAAILVLVYRFKRSQKSETPLNVLQILFLDPETETYSLSKLQFYLWTFAASFGYAYLAISRLFIQGERWPDIPDGLPAVIAMGAGTAVGAQIVQSTRGPKGGGAETPNAGDFVTSGGVAAPERVQMLVWTIVGVLVFMYAVLQHGPEEIVGLDPVPPGLLFLMGLSSLGYLGGKLARGAGPIINELSIVPAESDEALQAEDKPQLPDLTAARGLAEQAAARLQVAGGAAARPAIEALSAAIAAVRQATTLVAMQALSVTLAGELAKAEKAAAAAAAAVGQPGAPADAAQAAQTAQGAAAALQDLSAAIVPVVSDRPAAPVRTAVTRAIEVRGRNLSSQALFTIDQAELPFRMLRPNADGKRLPEVVIAETGNPTLAVVLRLTIDPAQMEETDLRQYRVWFGAASTKPQTFSVINLDGQRADISFTVPPSMAQKPTDPAGPTK